MKRLMLILCCGCLPVLVPPARVVAQDPPLNRGLTAADWHQDLRFLASELPRRHINAFHTISREDFDRRVAELDAQLDTLNNDAIVFGFAQVVSSIGDGHTAAHLPSDWPRFNLAPAWFGCWPDSPGPCELRVTSAAPGLERAVGAKVVRIAGAPVLDIHRRLATMIGQGESEGSVWSTSTSLLQLPNVIHGAGFGDGAMGMTFELEDSAGTRFTVTADTVPLRTAIAGWRSAATARSPTGRRRGEVFWWTLLPDSATVYVAFDTYPDNPTISRQTAELMSFINGMHLTRVILDLRRNGGGDFTKVRRTLLPAFKNHPRIGQRGGLYVLTGPATFSAAMVNAVDFRKDANAILVGLPTGARPNSYSENDEFRLPKSGMTVSYSTRYYHFQDEDTPGVIPDQRIEPTWASFRAGRDLAVEWVLAQPLPR